MVEQWRDVVGFPDYAVSDHGRVRRAIPDSRNHAPRILKPWFGNHGYETVGLARNGASHRRLVHRLVCEAFHGAAPSASHEVAHGDGTRTNNHASNLRWATRAENVKDSAAHGTQARGATHGRTVCPERTPRGAAHGHAKITEADVRAIRAADTAKGSGIQLAARYGLSRASISLIRAGKTWKHVDQQGDTMR